MDVNTETQEQKSPIIGLYKPKRKFLNFVTGLKGRVRILSKTAYLKVEKISGMLEGAICKITICDEGTINFEEVDTTLTDPHMIQRFIDEIDDIDVTGYVDKYVVSGLQFQDEEGKPCYLEVEYKKPIEQLFSLFDEKPKSISDVGLSLLDSLLQDVEIQSEKETTEEIVNELEQNDDVQVKDTSFMQDQFVKMNEEIIQVLKSRIENGEKEIGKIKRELYTNEEKLQKQIGDLKILQSRLDSFNDNDQLNGWVFSVSDEQKPEEVNLSDEGLQIATKIADIIGLKKDALFKMLTEGHYKIQIAKKCDLTNKELQVPSDLLVKIKSLTLSDPQKDAKVTVTDSMNFEYRGSLTWHQLVGSMIRKGFEQNAEFDKICGSNSYESEEPKTNDNK